MKGSSRRLRKGHAQSERWLVSYADFVTLLFAFFVVLFASTQSDRTRAQQISRAVNKALEGGSFSARPASSAKVEAHPPVEQQAKRSGPAATPGERLLQVDLIHAVTTLQSTLNSEVEQGQVHVHLEPRGAVISLNAQSVFPSGGDSIDAAVYPLLAKIAATLNQLPNAVRLEGHTDSQPIRNQRFQSNWELSAARSIAMLRILNERFGVGRERMAIVGYADTNALADNQTESGRTKNRRVDLVILSDYGTQAEPAARPSTAEQPSTDGKPATGSGTASVVSH